MKDILTKENYKAINYCYKDGEESIFIDRKDKVIKRFDCYTKAVDYARENIHLIDR